VPRQAQLLPAPKFRPLALPGEPQPTKATRGRRPKKGD
jgi:hypothetical protein